MSGLVIVTLEQGLVYAVLAMGVFITYKILDFPDLSVEGSFPLGAFVFAKLSLMGVDPFLSMGVAFLAGAAAGSFTYFLNIKLKIQGILAGILTMTFLYSVILRINQTSNISIINNPTVFDDFGKILVLSGFVVLIKLGLDGFLKTEMGYLLIATGDNEGFVKSLGENEEKFKLIGLALSNALVATSGGLMAQTLGFADITMKNGIIVVALASIIIGDAVFRKSRFIKNTTRAILGAVIYKAIGSIAIRLGLKPNDLQAISALIVIVFLANSNLPIASNLKAQFQKIVPKNMIGERQGKKSFQQEKLAFEKLEKESIKGKGASHA